jgi:hypothetical protein
MRTKAGAVETSLYVTIETSSDPHDPSSVRRLVYGTGWPKKRTKEAAERLRKDNPIATAKQLAGMLNISESPSAKPPFCARTLSVAPG